MELIVVLVILVALAALVLPRIAGVAGEADNATTANILAGVNRAVQQFEAQHSKMPTTWDYVIDENDAPYRLHANLAPLVQVTNLSLNQANSLREAGMTGGHYQDSTFTGLPHESVGGWSPIAEGRAVLTLVKPTEFGGHYVDFPDRAFGINQFNAKAFASEYVVLGLAGPTSLRGNTIMESPIANAGEPRENYARVLVVFRVPGARQTFFKAQYMGCFAPDGTTLNDQVNEYQASRVPLHE